MSDCTAKLCVWVTEYGEPCHIMQTEQFYVHVTDCHGDVLKWCDRTFSFIPTKCGMVEIEVPPGCYSVLATHTERKEGTDPKHEFGNRLTHVQVVRVNCGDHACVTLFAPTLWHCTSWFAAAVVTQTAGLEKAGIDPETIQAAVAGAQGLLEKLPKKDNFAAKVVDMMHRGPQK